MNTKDFEDKIHKDKRKDQKVNNEFNHKEDKKVVNNNSSQNAPSVQSQA